jgi:hypothetical protein
LTAFRRNGIAGLGTIVSKNLSKLDQFFDKDQNPA